MDAPDVVVRRIKHGDKTAEQELINHFWRPLYFIILRQSRNPTLAQDIVQDTMLIVLEKARHDLIETPEAIASFIRKVGESVLITHYRKETRRKTDTANDLDVIWPDTHSDVTNKINQQQLVLLVKQVMDELPIERDRKLLQSYFLEGKEKKQICIDLDLSAEHFDRVLHRSKQRLQQQLAIKFCIDLSSDSLASLLSIIFVLLLSGQQTTFSKQISQVTRGSTSIDHLSNVLAAQSIEKAGQTDVLRRL